MSDNYFKTLFLCILGSFGLLVVSHVLLRSPWMSLVAGAGPLVYYHLLYLAPRARKGLTQTAIDSVYYFGFLVTVAALGISAVTIASSGGATDINAVVFQFGVGLFATGYAVIARMHLSSLSTMVEEASPEAILDRYIKRSMEMLDNVEDAVVRTSEFSNVVISRTNEISDNARASAEKAMLDVARMFENEMKSTLALARDGITEVRGLVADTSFVTEREELARSIKATIEASTKLNIALGEYADRTREGAGASREAAVTSANLGDALLTLKSSVESLSGVDGALARASNAIAAAGQTIAEGTSQVGVAVGELTGIADAVVNIGPTFQKIKTNAKRAEDQLNALTMVSTRLDSALAGIVSTSEATGVLADGLERVGKALPALVTQSDALGTGFGLAVAASEQMARKLSSLPEQVKSVEFVTAEVARALQTIVDAIGVAAGHARELQSSTATTMPTVAGAHQLLASAGELQTTIRSLQQLLTGFGDSMRSTQSVLSDASAQIKSSVDSSADMLQADVRRASDAATMLTERLVTVAQTIIDQTRRQQGMVS